MILAQQKLENESAILENVLPRLNGLTLVWETLAPNIHHVTKVIVVSPVVLQQHVADALLTLQDLLEQDEVFVLHSVDIARQILSNLPKCQILCLMVVFIELGPQVAIVLLVDPLVDDLLAQHVAIVHVVAYTL